METHRLDFPLNLRITRAREHYGETRGTPDITRKEFAAILGVAYQRYCQWEQGNHTPGADGLAAIARVTGVDLNWLMEPLLEISGRCASCGGHERHVNGCVGQAAG